MSLLVGWFGEASYLFRGGRRHGAQYCRAFAQRFQGGGDEIRIREVCWTLVRRLTSCGVVFNRRASSAGRTCCWIISLSRRILAERLAGSSTTGLS